MEQRVLRAVRAAFPGTARVRLLVGFSGGPDSLALAALLARVAPVAGPYLTLLHVDHALRAESSAEAERAVELAGSLGLPIRVFRLTEHPLTRHPGVGLEEAARRERYRAFASVMREVGADGVALAHHRDDQAETVLLHLLRGAGLAGASGMAEFARIPVPWWEADGVRAAPLAVFRPLLSESRAELAAFVAGLGLEPVHDLSNDETAFRRNALRHEALPLLERVQPGAAAALARFAAVAAEEDEALDQLAFDLLGRARVPAGGMLLAELAGAPGAIVRRALRRWLAEVAPCLEPSFDRTEALAALALAAREGPIVQLGAGIAATVVAGELIAGRPDELEAAAWSRFPGPRVAWGAEAAVALAPDRPARIGEVRFILRADRGGAGERLPASAADGLVVRRVAPGDRFTGGGGPVRDWLRRHRVPLRVRCEVACVAGADGVLSVPGLPLPPGVSAAAGDAGYRLDWIVVEEWRG